ncbi:hypothetical protein Rhopal_005197-T1 [Rhodotorula paludigena]|uniref:NADH dehydrogenase [ubiquinone] 1 alpha subcomplex subunit 4 n=1 Tax=Rhodotorula paludigena TaxID=86838 RepID=A0AAV5GT16_9BASI|nr:hypothetical protein Rhopal_005197-T1 [Rhodotorula paludigena]
MLAAARVGLRAQVAPVVGRRSASTSATGAAKKTLWQTWYEPAAIPIWVVVGAACFGAGWYLTRLARHQDVIWDRHGNPEPWNNVKPKTLSKLYTLQPEYYEGGTYKRERL